MEEGIIGQILGGLTAIINKNEECLKGTLFNIYTKFYTNKKGVVWAFDTNKI